MNSGLSYTILKPEALTQNVLAYTPAIIAQGALYAPMPDSKTAMVDSRDVAVVAVAALAESGHEGKAYDITGPEVLSMNQIAEKLSAGLGKKVTCVEVSLDVMRKGMEAAGMPE